MHYYQHNIGDYRRDTSHLSLLEHGVYRTLLDLYYLDQKPIPKETQWVIRRLGAKTNEDISAIHSVLADFFIECDEGYRHKRCDIEIHSFVNKGDTARVNGKLGGRPPKTKVVILGNPDITEAKANQEPITINHKPEEEGKRAKALTRPDDVDAQVWSDWVQLRKAKKAPITETVLKTARKEAALADMPLVNFLEIWCARGSIGLEAAWLRNTDKSQASETVYQKSMRLRVAEISPALARPEPGRIGPDEFFANLAKQNRELANLTVLEIAR